MQSNNSIKIKLQTSKKNYGLVVLSLADQQKFQGYLPYLENSVNLIALILENRQQAEELQKLNIDLEVQVKDRIKSLQRSEERLAFALKGAHSGIWDWDLKTGDIFFDANYYTLAGYNPNEFPHTYKEWQTRVHPEDITQVEAQIEDYLAGRSECFAAEFRFRTKQGGWMWILSQGIVSEQDEAGLPLRFTGTHTDISKRKLTEDKLANQQHLLERSQELGHIGSWERDLIKVKYGQTRNTELWVFLPAVKLIMRYSCKKFIQGIANTLTVSGRPHYREIHTTLNTASLLKVKQNGSERKPM